MILDNSYVKLILNLAFFSGIIASLIPFHSPDVYKNEVNEAKI